MLNETYIFQLYTCNVAVQRCKKKTSCTLTAVSMCCHSDPGQTTHCLRAV